MSRSVGSEGSNDLLLASLHDLPGEYNVEANDEITTRLRVMRHLLRSCIHNNITRHLTWHAFSWNSKFRLWRDNLSWCDIDSSIVEGWHCYGSHLECFHQRDCLCVDKVVAGPFVVFDGLLLERNDHVGGASGKRFMTAAREHESRLFRKAW